jgi:hypothetical protein
MTLAIGHTANRRRAKVAGVSSSRECLEAHPCLGVFPVGEETRGRHCGEDDRSS